MNLLSDPIRLSYPVRSTDLVYSPPRTGSLYHRQLGSAIHS
jgi:hypothetical protein